MSHSKFTAAEKKLLAILAGVQFVNILDFMMVMPLGPDLGKALGIPMNHLGWIGGSYTFAAFLAGLLGTLYLDQMERKKALLLHLAGLSLATLAGAAATDMKTLLAARVAAGLFGGPATSSMLAIISDAIEPKKRGRALGLVMAAFSIASIVGVPIGLELARLGTWKTPFIVTGCLALLVAIAGSVLIPHLKRPKPEARTGESLFSHGSIPISIIMATLGILATFLLIPNLSAFLQFNVGFPRERLGLLYLTGGILSLFSTRLGGIWNDKVGSTIPLATSTGIFVLVLATGMLPEAPLIAPVPWFGLLMLGNSLRWISISTLTSKVAPPQHRGKYMSLLSAAQHLASSMGAFLSTQLLSSGPAGQLLGVHRLAMVSMTLSLCVPPMAALLERLLKKQPGAAPTVLFEA